MYFSRISCVEFDNLHYPAQNSTMAWLLIISKSNAMWLAPISKQSVNARTEFQHFEAFAMIEQLKNKHNQKVPRNRQSVNNEITGLLLPGFLCLRPQFFISALAASCRFRGVASIAFHAYLLVKQSCIGFWESCHLKHLGSWRRIIQSVLNDF